MMGQINSRDSSSEEVLVRRAIAGDASAFGTLYQRYLDGIYRYIYLQVEDETEAEDLTEEVFVRAWGALSDFVPQANSFEPWLFRIASNLMIDWQRKRRPHVLPEQAWAARVSALPAVDALVETRVEVEDLLTAIEQLSRLEKQVIILRFVEELSHREIGKVIGKSEEACRVIQHRAVKALRRILARGEN